MADSSSSPIGFQKWCLFVWKSLNFVKPREERRGKHNQRWRRQYQYLSKFKRALLLSFWKRRTQTKDGVWKASSSSSFFFFKNQQVKRVVAALKQCKRLALRVNCSAKMCSQFLRRRFSLLLRCCSFLILILLPVFSSSLFFDFLFSILYLLGLWLSAVCSLPWEVDVGWPAWQWKKKKDLQSVLY